MKKNLIFIGMALLCLNLNLSAQISEAKELNPGEAVPNLDLQNGFGKTYAKFSELKGKLVILDFWASWCVPCIAAFPKNESLQAKFGDKIQIINVGYQPKDIIKKSFDRMYPSGTTGFRWLTDDKTFVKIFPHTYLPHYVWIDTEGKYRTATEGKHLTEENIAKALKGDFGSLRAKTDKALNPKPESINNEEQILFKSVLSGYHSELALGYKFLKPDSSGRRKVELDNENLMLIYQRANYDQGYFNMSNTEFAVARKEAFVNFSDGQDYLDWLKDGNGYTWRISIPASANLFQFMRQQLKSFFPQYHSEVKETEKPGLALTRISDEDKIASKGGNRVNTFSGIGAELRNVPLNALVMQLKAKYMQNSKVPIVDETGYKGPVDLDIKANLSNVEEINQALAKYDLKFVSKMTRSKVLVISDSSEKISDKKGVTENRSAGDGNSEKEKL